MILIVFTFVVLDGTGRVLQTSEVTSEVVDRELLAAPMFDPLRGFLAELSKSASLDVTASIPSSSMVIKIEWKSPLPSAGSLNFYRDAQIVAHSLVLLGGDTGKAYLDATEQILRQLCTQAGLAWNSDLHLCMDKPLVLLFVLETLDPSLMALIGLLCMGAASSFYSQR